MFLSKDDFWRLYGNKILTFAFNVLYNTSITDIYTCYKLFRRDVVSGISLESNGFELDAELTCKVSKLSLRFYERGINYHGRTVQEGKKIKWIDGVIAVWTIIKYRFL